MDSNREVTDILIIVPPAEMKNKIWPPYGAMYIASSLREKGYKSLILDMDRQGLSQENVTESVRRIDPRYIGFSGIVATSYKSIKEISLALKQALPEKIQIMGGGLCSVAEAVLANSAIDIVVQGEGELTMVDLMRCLDERLDLSDVRGIFYKSDGSSRYTGPRELIRNLDSVPYPAFDLVDMQSYLVDGIEFIRFFCGRIPDRRVLDTNRKKKMINVITNRGCFGACSFCSRPYPGLRLHSIKYIFDFIEYCIDKFDVGFFSFGDECFASCRARNWEFINEYRKRKLDIIFRILGMRVDTVDKDILKAYKDIGCWKIAYGIESGSQKMLNIIDKKVSVEQNRRVIRWTAEAGIYTPPQIILGIPGETDKTVSETIDFVKSLDLDDFKQYKATYALPIPGSPLYDFAKISGIVRDEDEYLSSLTREDAQTGFFHVNLTDEPDEVVMAWSEKLKKELDDYYFYKKYRIRNPLMVKFAKLMESVLLHTRRKDILLTIAKKCASSIRRKKGRTNALEKNNRVARPKKLQGVNVESIISEYDYSKVNTAMSLKNINKKLVEITGYHEK